MGRPWGTDKGQLRLTRLVLQPVTQEMPQVLRKVDIEPLQFFLGAFWRPDPHRDMIWGLEGA